MSSEKKSGCGCCSFTVGCFFGMILLVALVVGSGFLFINKAGFFFDTGLEFAYPRLRPRIEKALPDNLNALEKKQVMSRLEQDIEGYLSLPAADRKAVRQKIIEMMKTWNNPQIDKEMQLKEIEALIQELKNKS